MHFVHKRRIDRRSNGGMCHFVLFELKPNNMSMLCMTIFLFGVWNISILCVTYFDYYFLSIFCMTLSLTSNIYIYYILSFIFLSKKMSPLTGGYGHVGHYILHKD